MNTRIRAKSSGNGNRYRTAAEVDILDRYINACRFYYICPVKSVPVCIYWER